MLTTWKRCQSSTRGEDCLRSSLHCSSPALVWSGRTWASSQSWVRAAMLSCSHRRTLQDSQNISPAQNQHLPVVGAHGHLQRGKCVLQCSPTLTEGCFKMNRTYHLLESGIGLDWVCMGIITQLASCRFLVPLLLVGHCGMCLLKQFHLHHLSWDLPAKQMTQAKW